MVEQQPSLLHQRWVAIDPHRNFPAPRARGSSDAPQRRRLLAKFTQCEALPQYFSPKAVSYTHLTLPTILRV